MEKQFRHPIYIIGEIMAEKELGFLKKRQQNPLTNLLRRLY
jgi:hypothetical protein